jgi:hypothetical protein
MRIRKRIIIPFAAFLALCDAVFLYRRWFYGPPVQGGGGGTGFLEPIAPTALDWTVLVVIIAIHVMTGVVLFRAKSTPRRRRDETSRSS